MSLRVYIVISFDSGPVCLTDDVPGLYDFSGESLLFTDELVSYTLPSRSMDLFSNAVSGQSMSVSFFSDILTPGRRLSSSNRVQRSRLRAIVRSDEFEIIAFDGEVSQFSFDVGSGVAQVKAIAPQAESLLEFPPGRLLEEGRFVRRETIDPNIFDGIPTFATGIQYLVPLVEFKTEFGTPSDPNVHIVFEKTEIQVTDTMTISPNGSFLFFDSKASDLAVPVVYGRNTNVALNVLGHYRVRSTIGGFQTLYYKVFIVIVAAHRVVGEPATQAQGGCDFGVRVLLDSFDLSESFDANADPHFANGHYGVDGLGTPFSYFTYAVEHFPAGSNNNYEEAAMPTSFEMDKCHMPVLYGKTGENGGEITGLGDFIFDAWSSYTELGVSTVDVDGVSNSREELNAYSVDAVFNDVSSGQSLIEVLSNRIQGQFPVQFSYVNGRLSWQSSTLPYGTESQASLIYGVNAYSRGEISETPVSDIVNNMSVSYGANGNSKGRALILSFNKDNNPIARSSCQNWGESGQSKLEVGDAMSADTVSKIAENILRLYGGVRMKASYDTDDLSLFNLPFLSIVEVTDEESGFHQEPFYFLGSKWNSELTGFTVSLLSVKMI